MKKGLYLWSLASVLVSALSLGQCFPFNIWRHNEATITVSAGQISVEAGFDKVSSLMTGLDYEISRWSTINGLAMFNYYRECVPDFGEKICAAMERKHQTSDQEIFHTDNGLAINFVRNIILKKELRFTLLL